MERSWYWKLVLVLAVVGLAAYYTAPTIFYLASPPEVRRSKDKLAEAIPSWLPNKRMNLGIDLQGGLHLVMGVDTEKAVLDRADRVGDELVSAMKEKSKPLASVTRVGDRPTLEIKLNASDDFDTLKTVIEAYGDTWVLQSHLGTSVTFAMADAFEEQVRNDSVEQALKTLRNRIDAYGVKEAEIRRRGTNSILIQIAGITEDEEESIKGGIIGKTAQLEFKLVDDDSTYLEELAAKGLPAGVTLERDSYRGREDALVMDRFLLADSKDLLQKAIALQPPPSDRVIRFEEVKQKAGPSKWRTWLLERKTQLTGDFLVDAFVQRDTDQNSWFVSMRFDPKGAEIFGRLTAENVKRRMAIVLDDLVDSAPIIQTAIPNGSAQITLGGFKSDAEIFADAKELALVLKAGALPAPLYPQEQRTVGATLGEDAIAKGESAIFATAIITILLLLGYYRGTGAVGLVALSVNMLMMMAGLSMLGATLTLPGLAGLALTMGMAIDANIIQFERIREELRAGKTARAAVDAGFDKAFSAIFDSNATTLVAAVILLSYGSGPVRGFASTLGMGVLINTFTAVVVPRLILDYIARGRNAQTLSI
ncbi:protein translocase subunit SecD [Myxococcota bacterium]|nr:protein translocase subunit SecD [Myxococcota bacterium]